MSQLTRGEVILAQISRSFAGLRAVENLDLTVRAGEFLSLLGPSGCGKTTTLRMVGGFDRPDSGAITISGERVEHLPPNRRDVNTVFQSYALFPHMDVAQNIAYGLRQRGIRKDELRKRVADALDLVQLMKFAHRKPDKLSGGQQQRVALARAIVNRPSVLLLDEPLAALDRQLRDQMQVDLKLLQADLGMTFIFVTHDQGEAMSMSDRIAVMYGGRIEQLATPSTIYDAPETAFVASFIGQQNFLDGTVSADCQTVHGTSWSLPVTAERAVGPATAVKVAIRPETVRLTAVDDRSGCALGATVLTVANLGAHVRYVLRLDGGAEFIAVTPRGDDSIRPNDPVFALIDPRRILVFSAAESTEVTQPKPLIAAHPHDRSNQ
ncbi:ABC transporter ATP-binding protein [Mycolicibacterium sp. CH28]|uniref:ABC transporter ATP-binding protein n=1 Tax=Mycolicibacterium sp. CH28 TaxID=2512237 RepID=UPI001F1ECB29|nr:ABC transporter ATP-binding protein [Mycolicibacterium sp. CH28]